MTIPFRGTATFGLFVPTSLVCVFRGCQIILTDVCSCTFFFFTLGYMISSHCNLESLQDPSPTTPNSIAMARKGVRLVKMQGLHSYSIDSFSRVSKPFSLCFNDERNKRYSNNSPISNMGEFFSRFDVYYA